MVNAAKRLQGLKYRMSLVMEEIDEVLEEIESEKRNVRLTKADANRVMGYKDPNYIYRLEGQAKEDFNDQLDEEGYIWFNDLWEWAAEHKPNRMTYMKKNITDYIKAN